MMRFFFVITALMPSMSLAYIICAPLPSACRRVSNNRYLVMQFPPKLSKFRKPDDPSYIKGSKNFPAMPLYFPDMNHPGDMKPGKTPENNPLRTLLKKGIPHRGPYFQEIPYHIRWPASHPASIDILEWIESTGRLLTECRRRHGTP
jgi:hypothetical protein